MAVVGGFSNIGLYQSARQPDNVERHDPLMDERITDARPSIDATPAGVAAIGFGCIALLFFLNKAGFRFSFGVSAGR